MVTGPGTFMRPSSGTIARSLMGGRVRRGGAAGKR